MILKKIQVGALVCLALLGIAVAGQTLPQVADGKVTGTGFAITVPPDVTVEPGATEESLHGFYIDLNERVNAGVVKLRSARESSKYRYIAFDTKWDAGDLPSLDAVVDEITSHPLDHIPSDLVAAGNVMLDANLPTGLGGLPARRLIIKYKNTEKQPAIRQVIVAYNARKDASALVYLFVLNTTQQNFQEDVSVFSKLLSGFKLTGQ